MEKIILFGGGGHCRVVIDAILDGKRYGIIGIIDIAEKIGQKVLDIPIIDDDTKINEYFKKGIKNCFITAGSTGITDLREDLFNLAQAAGFSFPNIMHTASLVSKFARFGHGNYIAPGVIINAGVHIGDNCIINSGAIVEHDCSIGDFVHIASGVVMGGAVSVGRCSHVGAGSSVLQGIKVGERSIIGTGSVVVDDIEDNVVACGSPCRKIKDND